jgi:cytochrome b pre-mRNA-processing protein 3
MHFFKSKKENILPLYNKIVFLTRESFFYKDFKLTDTFSNRIYLIFFHLSFILILLKNKESEKNNQQDIFDFFFRQIELNCRELGYADITVNKKMKNLIRLFYEILMKCENWKQLQIDNKNNLLLNFFSNNSDNKILTKKLANYFDKFALFIEDISLNSITKGVFNFVYKE